MSASQVTPAPVIAELRAVSKRYDRDPVLHALDLQVRRGEVLALLGPNGAGKTTALGLLTGRLSADGGEARLFGQDPRDWRARRQIGVMLQDTTLPETLKVREHIALYRGYYPQPRSLADTLRLAGLEDLAERRYETLSGGQQRRLQFALAICGNPPLLFVDEPTVGLDVEARRAFWAVLRDLRGEGCSIVLTTHYLEEADALADRIVLLDRGSVRCEGSPREIKAQASGRLIRCQTRLPLAQIRSWPEVIEAKPIGARVELRSASPEPLLRRLLAADLELADLEVLPLSLEDAFLHLTAPTRHPLKDAA